MIAEELTGFDLDTAPLAVREVRLLVRDLPRLAAFYTTAIGLAIHEKLPDRITLGAARPFLTLATRPGLARPEPGAPGLFHTAFLLPDRRDLGDWLDHARATGLQLAGASDHVVSEAIYLDDPEGNGIEVYADRPVEAWHDAGGQLAITTRRLATRAIPRGQGWQGAPGATRIGHVHLRVADVAAAEAFWTGQGFDMMARYPGASFFGAGGYHHQIAANVWNSAGRPPLRPDAPGLATLVLEGDVAMPRTLVAPPGIAVTFALRTH